MELDLAARALCQSLDLASGGRERVPDRDLDVHVAPVIGRLVADHDVLVGRNRHPDVDTIDGTVAVLDARLALAALRAAVAARRPPATRSTTRRAIRSAMPILVVSDPNAPGIIEFS